jgi:hypothetical protein
MPVVCDKRRLASNVLPVQISESGRCIGCQNETTQRYELIEDNYAFVVHFCSDCRNIHENTYLGISMKIWTTVSAVRRNIQRYHEGFWPQYADE